MNFLKFSFIILLLVLLGCKKERKTQAQIDEESIQEYMASRSLSGIATGSGLYYVITSQGNGVQASSSSIVTVKYSGNLIDGTVFDASPNTGATFGLNQVIKGWQEGIPYFKKGGKGYLLIPSALGYGSQSTGKIPANSVLIFEIELLDVK